MCSRYLPTRRRPLHSLGDGHDEHEPQHPSRRPDADARRHGLPRGTRRHLGARQRFGARLLRGNNAPVTRRPGPATRGHGTRVGHPGLVPAQSTPMGHPPGHPRRRMGGHRNRYTDRSPHPTARPGQRPHAHLRRDVLRQGRVVPPHPRLRRHVAPKLRPNLRRRQHVRAFRNSLVRRPPTHRQVAHRPRHADIRTSKPSRLAHHDRHLRRHHRAAPVPPRTQPLPQPRPHTHRRTIPRHRRHGDRHEPHVHPRRLPHHVLPGRLPLLRQRPTDVTTHPGPQAPLLGTHRRTTGRLARLRQIPDPTRLARHRHWPKRR